ncbi:MAG: extracellular solute-binding protein [Chitinivibrionales bacterium]|nr:extracellular solute-binding protein [Chitinivibrionales bacterium]
MIAERSFCKAKIIGAFLFGIVIQGCGPRLQTSVLIKMVENQDKYFRQEVIPPFEKEQNVDIDVISYPEIEKLEEELQKYAGNAGLVKVPFGKSASLIRQNLIKPLNSFLPPDEIKEYTDTYLLTSLSKYGEEYYFVPRKFETRIMVFRKSRVADALAVWRDHKDSIDAALKKINGYGLPAAYHFENDPNKWDFFDIFTCGWVWAHTSYGGKKMPRIAHRGKLYSGTSLRIVDRIFQCGGDSTAVLTMKGDAVADAVHWEAVYAAGGIYNKKMWEEQWSGGGVWKGFESGEVFLAFMTQLDCFFIHGTGQDNLHGYLDNPDDMGVAVMPTGCSVEVDNKGVIVREGRKSITTGGWWWGIPRTAPDPELSYKLARHITNPENQIQGCSRFGMIPVQKSILSDMSMMFGGGWVTEMYEVSFKQLMENKYTMVPSNAHFAEISNLYLEIWSDVIINKNWSSDNSMPEFSYIKKHIETVYAQKVNDLMGR